MILHRSSRRTQDVRAEVGRTRSEIIGLQALLATIEDAETGQRGYLLTGDQSYLAPYSQATALIESELYGLEGFQKGNRLLQANFLPLQRHILAKLSELCQTIGLCQHDDTSSARKMVLEGTGQREMGSIRSLISTLLTEQNHKLDQLQRENWPVTFSIGLISFLNSPESVEEMMSLADAMMYSVKQKGKNSIAARVLA